MPPPKVSTVRTADSYTADDAGNRIYGSWPWKNQAEELAQWVFAHCVNRTDCFGRYGYDLKGRHETDYAAFGLTVPVTSWTEHKQLTRGIVQAHFETTSVRNLIGIHTTSPDDTCKWICIDIDQHEPGVNELAERNAMAAMHWYTRLSDLGFKPLLWDSNGAGGFRLTALFDPPIPASNAFSFGHWLVADWKEFGLPDKPEVFPKQPSIKITEKRLGNFVRLPGRHHKRNFYAEIYSGERWLEGRAAIVFMLGLVGQSPSLMPKMAESFQVQPSVVRRRNRSSICCLLPSMESPTPVLARALAMLGKWRPAEMGDRNNALFRAGAVLGERLPIAEADHFAALLDFNARFTLPLGEAEVRKIARSAFSKTQSKRLSIEYAPGTVEQSGVNQEEDVVTLDRYRDLLHVQYSSIIGRPGIYLDRTPVGGGQDLPRAETRWAGARPVCTSFQPIGTRKR